MTKWPSKGHSLFVIRIWFSSRLFSTSLPAVHPIAFHLGPLTIHWYGVMIALAFLAGLWTATRRARRENISGEKIADVTLWLSRRIGGRNSRASHSGKFS
jgi:hypothetical protein